MLGLRFCARALSSCGERGPLFIVVRGPLTIAASLVAEHKLQTHRLSNCGSRAQLLRGMWDLPRPGLEPVSPALAGRLPTPAPPGKPHIFFLTFFSIMVYYRILNISYLCCTVGPCCWSILCIIAYICSPQPPTPSLPHLSPSLATRGLFSIDVSLFLFHR